jgi:hypothetical protein
MYTWVTCMAKASTYVYIKSMDFDSSSLPLGLHTELFKSSLCTHMYTYLHQLWTQASKMFWGESVFSLIEPTYVNHLKCILSQFPLKKCYTFRKTLFPGGIRTWILSSWGRCDDHCATPPGQAHTFLTFWRCSGSSSRRRRHGLPVQGERCRRRRLPVQGILSGRGCRRLPLQSKNSFFSTGNLAKHI